MSGNLEAVFSQVVVACCVAAVAAIIMREATTDRTLHLCARMLGFSAWTALLALSYFTVREYEKLEQVLIVRQSTKVAEPMIISKTEMELPSGITVCWTRTNAGRGFTLPDFSGQAGRPGVANRPIVAGSGGGGSGVPELHSEKGLGGNAGSRQTF